MSRCMIKRRALASGLARCIDGLQNPLTPGGIETDVKMITSTTDRVAEVHGFSHPLWVNQIDRGHVISTRVPSKRSKEGVRGPAAVDHKRIDGLSNLLKHVSHTTRSVRDIGRDVNR